MILEKGDAGRGLEHIVQEHGPQFAQKGIAEGDIPSFLQTALDDATQVGFQGKGTGRPIYEVLWRGRILRVAITVASNGYIVGADISGSG